MGLSAIAGVGVASAQQGAGPMSSLIDQIATKFNLNKEDVQKVFDENKAARETDHVKQQSDRLQKLVDAGAITTAQKTAIETKLKELNAEREADKDSMKDLTGTERKAKMDAKRTELETWAKAQGLDLTKLMGVFMGGHGMRDHDGPSLREK